MPGMNGYDVARHIKAAQPTLPVVLVTGWGIRVDDRQLKASGVDRLVVKPFHATEMAKLVQELFPRNKAGGGDH
jgi:CheY-like chemotaxis protein